MNPWIPISIVACVGMVAAVVGAGMFNRLVRLNNHCDNAFAQIEVQLKRRYDLIPNLVECVKSYMVHERETLERVIAARNVAAVGLEQATRLPGDPDALQKWMGAEGL